MPHKPKIVKLASKPNITEQKKYRIIVNPSYDFIKTSDEIHGIKDKYFELILISRLNQPFLLDIDFVPVLLEELPEKNSTVNPGENIGVNTESDNSSEKVNTGYLDVNNNEYSDHSEAELEPDNNAQLVQEIMIQLINEVQLNPNEYIKDFLDVWYNQRDWHPCPNCGTPGHSTDDCNQPFDYYRIRNHYHVMINRRRVVNQLQMNFIGQNDEQEREVASQYEPQNQFAVKPSQYVSDVWEDMPYEILIENMELNEPEEDPHEVNLPVEPPVTEAEATEPDLDGDWLPVERYKWPGKIRKVIKEKVFQNGEQVMLRRSVPINKIGQKIAPEWKGPYGVKKRHRIDQNVYVISTSDTPIRDNADRHRTTAQTVRHQHSYEYSPTRLSEHF